MEWKSTNFRVASQLAPSFFFFFPSSASEAPFFTLNSPAATVRARDSVQLRRRRRLQSDHVLREPAQGARRCRLRLRIRGFYRFRFERRRRRQKDGRTDGRTDERTLTLTVAAVEAALHF